MYQTTSCNANRKIDTIIFLFSARSNNMFKIWGAVECSWSRLDVVGDVPPWPNLGKVPLYPPLKVDKLFFFSRSLSVCPSPNLSVSLSLFYLSSLTVISCLSGWHLVFVSKEVERQSSAFFKARRRSAYTQRRFNSHGCRFSSARLSPSCMTEALPRSEI